MSRHSWSDVSTVTVAEPRRRFEFVTEGRAGAARQMVARWLNRYEIVAGDSGCRITYTIALLEARNAFLRLRLPLIRTLTWRLAIPQVSGRGLGNLARMAEERDRDAVMAVAPSSAATRMWRSGCLSAGPHLRVRPSSAVAPQRRPSPAPAAPRR